MQDLLQVDAGDADGHGVEGPVDSPEGAAQHGFEVVVVVGGAELVDGVAGLGEDEGDGRGEGGAEGGIGLVGG